MKALLPTRPSRSRPQREAFTFIELLVVVFMAVIVGGIILALLLRMRDQGGRAHCENNLRQIGEAIYRYRDHAAPHTLPPSRIADGYATWAVLITPYLDKNQGGHLRDWDLTRRYFTQTNEVRQAQVGVFFCPARRSPGHQSVSGDVEPDDNRNVAGALGDYACSAGDGDPAHPWSTDQTNGALVPAEILKKGPDQTILRWRGRTDLQLTEGDQQRDVVIREGTGHPGPIRDLKRGTSFTILIGDKHVRSEDFGKAEFGDGSVYNGSRPVSHARIGGPGHGLARSPSAPFDVRFPVFGSWHPRGMCNFLMADGGVRAIDPLIDERVLANHTARQPE